MKKNNMLMKIFMFFIFLTIMELIIVLLKWYLTGFGELAEINHMIRILVYSAVGSFFYVF